MRGKERGERRESRERERERGIERERERRGEEGRGEDRGQERRDSHASASRAESARGDDEHQFSVGFWADDRGTRSSFLELEQDARARGTRTP